MGEDKRYHERRQWNTNVQYPFHDSDGNEVVQNRRRVVDRRLSSMPSQASVSLKLRYGGRETVLGDGRLRMGRHSSNDLVINHPLVSRYHGVILPVSGGYMLVDTSRNGTFLRLDSTTEDIQVYAGEFILRGHGVFRLGRSTDAPGEDDLVYFELN